MTDSLQLLKQELIKEFDCLRSNPRGDRPCFIIPCLEDWDIHIKDQRLYIVGKVNFHSKYSNGSPLRTSAILSHLRVHNRLMVMTQNSIYELGQPSDKQSEQGQEQGFTLKPQYYSPLPNPWDVNGKLSDEMTELQSN